MQIWATHLQEVPTFGAKVRTLQSSKLEQHLHRVSDISKTIDLGSVQSTWYLNGTMIVFLDTEFTNFVRPELLSIGMVTLDGHEHYCEIDLSTEAGQARRKASSDFVRDEIFDMWGRIPGSSGTEWEIGRRTGEWLLELSERSGTRIEVAFDYEADFELMSQAIRESGLWDQVREIVVPINVGPLTGSPGGEIAAEQHFRELSRRGLRRHHALADAGALRAAYAAVKAVALQMARAGQVRT